MRFTKAVQSIARAVAEEYHGRTQSGRSSWLGVPRQDKVGNSHDDDAACSYKYHHLQKEGQGPGVCAESTGVLAPAHQLPFVSCIALVLNISQEISRTRFTCFEAGCQKKRHCTASKKIDHNVSLHFLQLH